MAANYTALLTEVADWIKRDDQTSRIPSYIAAAESRMNALLRLRIMQSSDTLTLSSGSSSASLPSDFLEPIALVYATGDGPEQVDIVSLTDAQDTASSSGRPKYFAYQGTSVLFERAADADYSLTLRYYAKLDLASTSTNAVNTAAPFAYLYGALAAFCSWDENDAGAQRYERLFGEQVSQLIVSDNASQGRASLRVDSALLIPARFDMTTGGF